MSFTCPPDTCIYNLGNYISLIDDRRGAGGAQIYNSRNYISLIDAMHRCFRSRIYNSRNYISLIDIKENKQEGINLQ